MVMTYGQTPLRLFDEPHPKVARKNGENGDWLRMETRNEPKVLPHVRGLRWGRFLGAPGRIEPKILMRQNVKVFKFANLDEDKIFGLPLKTTLVTRMRKDVVVGAVLVAHREEDGIVLAKLKRNEEPKIIASRLFGVTVFESTSEALFFGTESGVIRVLKIDFDASKLTLDVTEKVALSGHDARVNDLHICEAFSILVSVSADKSVLVFDSKTFELIRRICLEEAALSTAVSATSGEMAFNCRRLVRVTSINGASIGVVKAPNDPISTVAFSSAPEGVSCNVLVTGHEDGKVRFFNSWNLTPLRTLTPFEGVSVSALAFTRDQMHLLVANDVEVATFGEDSKCNLPKLTQLTL